jgi:hypothetical protein
LLAAAATLEKVPPLIEGVGTTLQLDPLKCSLSVPLPTAQISLSAIAAVAVRVELLINGLGTTTSPVNKLRSSRYSKRGGVRSVRALFAPRRL